MRDIDRVDCQKLFPRDDMSNIEGITTRSGESSGLRLSKGNILWRGCWQYLTCGVTSKHVHRVRAMFGCTMMSVLGACWGAESTALHGTCVENYCGGCFCHLSSLIVAHGARRQASNCRGGGWVLGPGVFDEFDWNDGVKKSRYFLTGGGGHIRKPFYSCSSNLSALWLICHLPS